HDDLGLATANSLAGVQNGAVQIECAMNGLGERAGNASLEEVVMAIRTRADVFGADTQVESKEIARTSRMVGSLMGIPVQPNKAIVGANAFAHSSGIHQDGILKSRATFEIIRPEDVGITEHRLVLTARSGRHALRHRLEELGYDLSDKNFEEIYERFIAVADKKREVSDEDLEAIVGEQIAAVPEAYRLVAMRAIADTEATPSAYVRVACEGDVREGEATGDGPVDALFRAIDQATGWHLRLREYAVRSITSGREAMGEVSVHAEVGGAVTSGRATATDIIEASARAYVNAINRAVAAGLAPE
ncbi:MAG TPA: 2-isopropylmalate synthase, partial [Planctomycetaceae bacterium]|nr:2-isopropylmalate synthase [Planctomycetaceae bacterium]